MTGRRTLNDVLNDLDLLMHTLRCAPDAIWNVLPPQGVWTDHDAAMNYIGCALQLQAERGEALVKEAFEHDTTFPRGAS